MRVAGADDHPGGRQPVFANAVLPDQGGSDVEVGKARLRQLVEEQDPPALARQPVRPASHGAAVRDPRHAAQVGRIAGGEVGIDQLPAEIIRDSLGDVALAEARVAPRHRHQVVLDRGAFVMQAHVVAHDRCQHGREFRDVHSCFPLHGLNTSRPRMPFGRGKGAAEPRARSAEPLRRAGGDAVDQSPFDLHCGLFPALLLAVGVERAR